MLELVLFSGLAGITVFIGGLLAVQFDHHVAESPVKGSITHTIMAFGAGVILSALALVLVPAGMEGLSLTPFILAFLAGALVFMWIDQALAKKGGQTATLLAMLMDFIPEAMALGATFAADHDAAILLAVFMGLQNLPEAFNSFRDLVLGGFAPKKALIIFFFLSFFGIVGALLGHFLLRDSPIITASLMTFASGGILYLLIKDIIPESNLKQNYFIPLGTTLGFLVGVIGEKLI